MRVLVAQDNKPKQTGQLEKLITFKRGLPGLGNSLRFTLHVIEDNPLFYYLQSTDEEDIGLILVDPFPCFPEYSLELNEQDKNELELDRVGDVLVFATVTLQGDSRMTANLAAPVVLNSRKGLAKQVIFPERIEEMRVPLPVSSE